MNMKTKLQETMRQTVLVLTLSIGITILGWAHSDEEHGKDQIQTLTGEVVDLMCYLDHGGVGEKHRECAETCIKSGGPIGLLVSDKVYLVVGEHRPINDQLAPFAGKEIVLKGKVVERSGMRMIENVEIVKK